MIWTNRGTDRTGADTWLGCSMGRTFIIRASREGVTLQAQTWVEHGFDTVDEAKAHAEEMA